MFIKKSIKIILLLFASIMIYIIFSFILLLFPSQKLCTNETKTIYIYHDTAHTEIMIPVHYFKDEYQKRFPNLLKGQNYGYLAFSYGDKEFMMKVPTWSDVKLGITLKSLFTNTPGLLRVGHYGGINKEDSVKITLSKLCLEKLQKSILNSFSEKNNKFQRYFDHYKHPKVFYFQAKKSYNLFNTCNTWTGDRLRDAGLKVSYHTPFAQQVIYPYQ
ncbi:MAG TPA: DUF2459 domain-containing protein [Campylobacterales bacterium]|nr:DUF2459 domain-containing protein [Campylobacterales bacterium]